MSKHPNVEAGDIGYFMAHNNCWVEAKVMGKSDDGEFVVEPLAGGERVTTSYFQFSTPESISSKAKAHVDMYKKELAAELDMATQTEMSTVEEATQTVDTQTEMTSIIDGVRAAVADEVTTIIHRAMADEMISIIDGVRAAVADVRAAVADEMTSVVRRAVADEMTSFIEQARAAVADENKRHQVEEKEEKEEEKQNEEEESMSPREIEDLATEWDEEKQRLKMKLLKVDEVVDISASGYANRVLKIYRASPYVSCFNCRKQFTSVDGYARHVASECLKDITMPIVPMEYLNVVELQKKQGKDITSGPSRSPKRPYPAARALKNPKRPCTSRKALTVKRKVSDLTVEEVHEWLDGTEATFMGICNGTVPSRLHQLYKTSGKARDNVVYDVIDTGTLSEAQINVVHKWLMSKFCRTTMSNFSHTMSVLYPEAVKRLLNDFA